MTKFGKRFPGKPDNFGPEMEVQDIYIDLEKAASAKHADYMFPLMRATNDCVMYVKYGKYLLSDQNCPNDLLDFAWRTRQAQMFEALQAFIIDIIPVAAGSEPEIYTYLMAHPRTAEQFSKIRAFAENSEMMKSFKNVRNKLVFHYDVRASHTRKALKALALVADKQPRLGAQPLIRSAETETRFFCADMLTSVSWTLSHDQYDEATFKIAEPITLMPDNEHYAKYVEFSGEALGEFYYFGLSSVLTWLEREGLALDIDTYKHRFKRPFC